MYSILTKETETLAEYDQLYYSIEFSSDAKSMIIEQDSCIYYLNMDDDISNKKKILDGYDFIKIKRISRDRVSIIYNQEGLTY